jgi:hypothetical protein
MVNLGAFVWSKWAQVGKNALAIFSQAAFLHTNYSRNPELSCNNLAILPVIDSSKKKNSCCS